MIRLLAISLFLMLGFASNAQVFSDYEKQHLQEKSSESLKLDHDKKVEKSSATATIFLNGLFLGYKKFVSSQDASSCSFYPSCSEYFVYAVYEYGIIKGGLLFGDRFQRCNSLSKENYSVYKNTNLLYDPIPCDHGHCLDSVDK